ncbi:hypothetical protein ACFX15_044236 [Malus domestica]
MDNVVTFSFMINSSSSSYDKNAYVTTSIKWPRGTPGVEEECLRRNFSHRFAEDFLVKMIFEISITFLVSEIYLLWSIFISVLIISSVIPLLRNSAKILLQRFPRAHEQDLRKALIEVRKIRGVSGIRNWHVWSFTNSDVVVFRQNLTGLQGHGSHSPFIVDSMRFRTLLAVPDGFSGASFAIVWGLLCVYLEAEKKILSNIMKFMIPDVFLLEDGHASFPLVMRSGSSCLSRPCLPKGAGVLESRFCHFAWCCDLPESMLGFERNVSLVVLFWFRFANLAVALFGPLLLVVAFFRSRIYAACGSSLHLCWTCGCGGPRWCLGFLPSCASARL